MNAVAETLDQPRQLVPDLTALLQRLTDLLEQENHLLESRRPRALVPYQEEKERLVQAYSASMHELKTNPGIMANASPTEVAGLKTIGARFQQVLEHHRRKIMAMRSATEGIIKAISKEVSSRTEAAPGYNAQARQASLRQRPNDATPISLALNQVV